MYGALGWVHARLDDVVRRRRGGSPAAPRGHARERGQGTVEYVALILLVALVMAGVVASMKNFKTDGSELGEAIITKIKEAVQQIQF